MCGPLFHPKGASIGSLFGLCFLFILLTDTRVAFAGLVLNEHIRHFEPVFYDCSHLRRLHRRSKRDISPILDFDFTAHNREFKVRLKRDSSIFTEDVVFESTDGPIDFDFGKVYSGTLEDDDLVEVEGILTPEGIFDGHISTPNELFYMEPSSRYFKEADFHSVMYKASDVIHPSPARCASQQLHLRGKVHNPWVSIPYGPEYPPAFEPLGVPRGPQKRRPHGAASPFESPSSITSTGGAEERALGGSTRPINPKHSAVIFSNKLYRNVNNKTSSNGQRRTVPAAPPSSPFDPSLRKTSSKTGSSGSHQKSIFGATNSWSHARRKRSITDPKKTTCMLYLQADHLFFRQEGTEEACIDKITRHVQRVNNIYKVTDFDRNGRQDNIGFMIKRIKIHTENATKDPNYRFPGNYGVEKFLELFSEEDYDSFCLAYMFTYRDFEGGTLGLAWTGDLKNAGGVCEKNGHYRGSLKSLNTGIVTLLNYGKKVPPAVSHVTLAHEIGHNFGSPHDPEKDLRCTPGGEDGNYIMFARATSGDKRNNNKFSPCSLKQINSVLNSKARDAKGCFTEPQKAICGNGVVEEGEECDCGWQEDCEEPCCFPMVNNPKSHQRPCTLRPGRICSPSQGPCCTYQCDYKQGDLCRDDNGCRDAAFCDGRTPYCPPSINKENKTICKEEFVCFKGECTGSICLAYGLESCQCKRGAGDPETKSCELCCKLPGEDNSCLSSFDWNIPPFDVPDMFAKPGTPCDNYKGYCDVFQKCREVDPSGPLATLRKILLSNETFANLQRWIIEHWYIVLFIAVALIVILIAITRVFGRRAARLHSTKRHRKSKKVTKKKTIIHKNSNTGGHFVPTVPDGANHVVHPTVVRANIPFKRKVNEVRRAATKAKRVAKSQLGKPYRKSSGHGGGGGVTSPTESEKSVNGVLNGISCSKVCPVVATPIKNRDKDRVLSSRFSIISFKTCRTKTSSPVKSKDKKKTRSKTKSKNHRSRSPDKRKQNHEIATGVPEKVKLRIPTKRSSQEDEKRKNKHLSRSPEKGQRSASPEKARKHRNKSPDKRRSLVEGNWLINKFLADEEKLTKPIMNGSLNGSLNGSPGGSPLINTRNGSTTALLTTPPKASPVRGFVNEAFVGSPKGVRSHSSLRITKSVSPDNKFDLMSNKYRRSISMEAYNIARKQTSPDKRKRSSPPATAVDGSVVDKRRRLSNADKPKRTLGQRPHSIAVPERTAEIKNCNVSIDKSKSSSELSSKRKLPKPNAVSRPSSANNSYSSVPDRVREKLSLITASPSGGSLVSVVAGPDEREGAEVSCPVGLQSPPKDWV